MVLLDVYNIFTANSYRCNDMCPKSFNEAVKKRNKKVRDNLKISLSSI